MFTKGRMFFEAATKISDSALSGADPGPSFFTLVPGRCIVERDAQNVSRIRRVLPLPHGVAEGTIEIFKGQLRLWPQGAQRDSFDHSPQGVVRRSRGLSAVHSRFPGAALSFDVFNTLAVHPSSGLIYIGTGGGLLRAPWTEDGRDALRTSGSNARLLIPSARAAKTSLDVRWIRWKGDEHLCGIVGLYRDAHDFAGSAGHFTGTRGNSIAFHDGLPDPCQEDGGIRVGKSYSGLFADPDKRWDASNDAFWLGRRPLVEIVAFDHDEHKGPLWVATRRHGAFKVWPDSLK